MTQAYESAPHSDSDSVTATEFGTTNTTTESRIDALNAAQPPPLQTGILSYAADATGNVLTLRLDAANSNQLDLIDDATGAILAYSPLQGLTKVHITGADNADDTLTVNMSEPFWLSGGIVFDGGEGGYDTLALVGPQNSSVHYTAIGTSSGQIEILRGGLGTNVSFTGLEPVYISGGVDYTFTPAAAQPSDSTQTIDPTQGVDLTIGTETLDGVTSNVLSGTIGGVPFEQVNLLDVSNLTIDLSGGTTTPHTSSDNITITSDGFVTQNLQNVTIRTGSGADTIQIIAADLSLPVSGGMLSIDTGDGDDQIVFFGSSLANAPEGALVIDLGAGTDTFDLHSVTTDLVVDLQIDGTVSVTDGSVTFADIVGVDSIVGGTEVNTYAFQDGAGIAGSIGGPGVSFLDYSAYTTPVVVDLSAGSATGTAVVTGVVAVIGGEASDTVVGPDADTIWIINGTNSFAADGIEFSGVEAVVAGTGADTVSSSIDGAVWTIEDSGKVAVAAVGFSGVEALSAGGAADTVIGPSGGAIWRIVGTDTGEVSDVVFTGAENLNGASGNDIFVIAPAGRVTGAVDGGGGLDALDLSETAAALTVAIATNGNLTVSDGDTTVAEVSGWRTSLAARRPIGTYLKTESSCRYHRRCRHDDAGLYGLLYPGEGGYSCGSRNRHRRGPGRHRRGSGRLGIGHHHRTGRRCSLVDYWDWFGGGRGCPFECGECRRRIGKRSIHLH